MRRHVVVVGAGIGGATAALSLHAAGMDVTVIEAVSTLRPVGVGINLQPHAVRELTELGLGGALAHRAVETAFLRLTDRFGNDVLVQPRGRGLGYRWPQYSMHRGELQMLLLDTVRHRLGDAAVHTGARYESLREDDDGVLVTWRDRATGTARQVRADVVVGADGVRSTVREQQHPGRAPLHHAGQRMWRGVCETGPFLDGRTMVIVGSNARPRFVAYPISRPSGQRGRCLVNWVAEVPADTTSDPSPDWDRLGDRADVLAHFDGWGPVWLGAAALIRGSDTVHCYPMVDREPLPSWGDGRVTLVGDAAHAMLPVGSNGGSTAIVDARVLARELASTGDAVEGLRRYQESRRPTTTALVLATRANPVDTYMRRVEERAPDGFVRVRDVLDDDELAELDAIQWTITNEDVPHLNSRPSLTVRHRP